MSGLLVAAAQLCLLALATIGLSVVIIVARSAVRRVVQVLRDEGTL